MKVNEEQKAKHFERGLRPLIQEWVAIFGLLAYAEVVNKALIVEIVIEEHNKRKDLGHNIQSTPLQGGSFTSDGTRPPKKAQYHSPQPYQQWEKMSASRHVVVRCHNCGKIDHVSLGCPTVWVCFHCQQPGHILKDCSLRSPHQQQCGGWLGKQAHVFTRLIGMLRFQNGYLSYNCPLLCATWYIDGFEFHTFFYFTVV